MFHCLVLMVFLSFYSFTNTYWKLCKICVKGIIWSLCEPHRITERRQREKLS